MKEKSDSSPILIETYNYPLPDDKIAKYPLEKRDASKLLVYQHHTIHESVFSRLPEFIPGKSLLIYNNTRVIQARMIFHKSTGARIEIFCLEPVDPSDYALSLSSSERCVWKCMVGNLKKWKSDSLEKTITLKEKDFTLKASLMSTSGNTHEILFEWTDADICFAEILDQAGELPIPPYLNRPTEEKDKTTYQTVYSKIKGSVAAPTAGLHFTPEVFEQLKEKDIQTDEVTLHVGAGTFQPVKADDIAEHEMHTEVISVHIDTIRNIRRNLGNIIAVGTTSVRTLESLYYLGLKIDTGNRHVEQWEPYEQTAFLSADEALQRIESYMEAYQLTILHAQTQIMIKPGFEFKIIRGMITNFHQPKSTLLLLVSAFTGDDWLKIYHYALENDFRFLSYGDSSLLLK